MALQPLPRVYAITPSWGESTASVERLADVCAELLLEGCLVQLRQKRWSARTLSGLLERLARRLPSDVVGRLLLNDRCDVALCFDGVGVHLPEASLPLPVARELLGSRRLLGASCHEGTRLAEAARVGADLATLGPVFPTPGKTQTLGAERLRLLGRGSAVAVYALGGLDRRHVGLVRDCGVHGIAAIRAIFEAASPAAAVRELADAWGDAGAPGEC